MTCLMLTGTDLRSRSQTQKQHLNLLSLPFTCRELYFEAGSISSVYLWDLDNGFAGCFLIKKRVQGNEFVKDGCWDSIHIVEATEESSSKATYKLTTTVIVHMGVDREEVGNTTLSGTLTRQVKKHCSTLSHHSSTH